jgi:hypothetical protein
MYWSAKFLQRRKRWMHLSRPLSRHRKLGNSPPKSKAADLRRPDEKDDTISSQPAPLSLWEGSRRDMPYPRILVFLRGLYRQDKYIIQSRHKNGKTQPSSGNCRIYRFLEPVVDGMDNTCVMHWSESFDSLLSN